MSRANKPIIIKQLAAMLAISLVFMLTVWGWALWYTGARLDYRPDKNGALTALRLAPQAGLSYQWSSQGASIWLWTPDMNTRLWVKQ